MRAIIVILFFALSGIGCATTNLPPVTSSEYTFEEDERRLWLRSEEEQEEINDSGLVFKDKKLYMYLDSVGKKLQPSEVYDKIPFTFVVLKNPYSNAFAYPNGVIYIHTGLLARMDNEAQLATLLAHEMTHSTHRHQIREYRGLRNKTTAFASVRAVVGQLPALSELTSVLGDIGTRASISGHSRTLETEADMEGIQLVINAGYDAGEAPKLFHHLKTELEEENVEEPFFFGSHPLLQDRIENYEEHLKENSVTMKGTKNTKVFRKKTAGVVFANSLLDLKAGRFQSAQRGVEKYLSIYPRSSKGHYLLGEIYRQQGSEEDLEKATKNYKKAVALNNSYPEAYKGLGLIYFKQGEKAKARKAFRSYLKLSPKASDRDYIKDYIAQCK